MIKVSVDQRTKQVLIDAGNLDKTNKEVIKQCWYDTGELVKNRVATILNTGTRTGRVYNVNGRSHVASAPGEAPKTRTGRLAKSGDSKVSGWRQLVVGETAPYARFLEDGTQPMGGRSGARKHVIKGVNETSGATVNIFYTRLGRKLKK